MELSRASGKEIMKSWHVALFTFVATFGMYVAGYQMGVHRPFQHKEPQVTALAEGEAFAFELGRMEVMAAMADGAKLKTICNLYHTTTPKIIAELKHFNSWDDSRLHLENIEEYCSKQEGKRFENNSDKDVKYDRYWSPPVRDN